MKNPLLLTAVTHIVLGMARLASASTDMYFQVFQATDEPCPDNIERGGTRFHIDEQRFYSTFSCTTDCHWYRGPKNVECPKLDDKRIAIFAHGFIDSASNFVEDPLKTELLTKYDAVVLVDWSEHCGHRLSNINPLNWIRFRKAWEKLKISPENPGNTCSAVSILSSYQTAVKEGVPHAAGAVAKFVEVAKYLKQGATDLGKRLEEIHLIGHSLGSHVMGQAAAKLQSRFEAKIGRITGLDPASPGFYEDTTETYADSLDKSDARFVDVIHTNAQCLGVDKQVGHLDIFARNDTYQSAVISDRVGGHHRSRQKDRATLKKATLMAVRHSMAIEIFADSINNCRESYPEISDSRKRFLDKASKRGRRKNKGKSKGRVLKMNELQSLGFDNGNLEGLVAVQTFGNWKKNDEPICFMRGKVLTNSETEPKGEEGMFDSPTPERPFGRRFKPWELFNDDSFFL